MGTIYVFLADGFEDIEALATVDILRRAGQDVVTVSIMADKHVMSTHGVCVTADRHFNNLDFSDALMLILPGGLPGSTNLRDYKPLQELLLKHNAEGKLIAAICAAPMALGNLGLLKGKKATCYPGCENTMTGAQYTRELCTVDGNIITGEGPAAAFPFAYTILDILGADDAAEQLKEGMMYNHLLAQR